MPITRIKGIGISSSRSRLGIYFVWNGNYIWLSFRFRSRLSIKTYITSDGSFLEFINLNPDTFNRGFFGYIKIKQ